MAARKSSNKGKRTVMGAPNSDGAPYTGGAMQGKSRIKNVKKTIRPGNRSGNPFARKGK